ncbi:MAG: hypothetical protein ACK4UJ_12225 [Leptonema sp. (in: bacteria)]
MKLIDHLVSLNATPIHRLEIYAQQALQNYREIQNFTNAKRIHVERDTSVVNIQPVGIENNIQNNYKIQEKLLYKSKTTIEEKETTIYQPKEFFFTSKRIKNTYNKGTQIDVLI